MDDKSPDSECLKFAKYIDYLHEDFTFILIFENKSESDKAAEFLITLFGVSEIGLLFHYNDDSINLEICTLNNTKSAKIDDLRFPESGYYDSLKRIQESFDDEVSGPPMKEKMMISTATVIGFYAYQRSSFRGTVGLSNVKYISANRI